MQGTGQSAFAPNRSLTNQEAAVILVRAAAWAGLTTDLDQEAVQNILAQFADYRQVAPWAAEAVAYCFAAGLSDSTALEINPEAAIKRGDMAEMLYRMLGKADLLR